MLLVILTLLVVVVDRNSILSQQIAGQHKSALIGTCKLLIYSIIFIRIIVSKEFLISQ